MKKTLTLLLASVLLAFSLTACGGKDQHATGDSGVNTGETMEDGSATGGAEKEEDLPGEHRPETESPAEGGGSVLTGEPGSAEVDTARQSHRSGHRIEPKPDEGLSTFDQMVRNARVHDTDGFLKDMENSVSPGAA